MSLQLLTYPCLYWIGIDLKLKFKAISSFSRINHPQNDVLQQKYCWIKKRKDEHSCHLLWNQMTKPNKQIHTWLVPAAGYKHSGQLPESLGRSQRRDKGPQIRASPFASSDGRPTLGIKTFNTIWPHFSTQTDISNWVCVHLQSTAPRTLEGLTFSRD